MNRASSATGWVRNPVMKLPNLDPTQASSYDLGWTLNTFSGCLNRTPEGLCLSGMFPCYAFKLANGRLRTRYLANENVSNVGLIYTRETTTSPRILAQPKVLAERLADPFYPRFWPERLKEFSELAYKPRGIFVCDMSDLFGIGVPEEWTRQVLSMIKYQFFHRFYLLTKQPQNLIKFSPFPDNCWVGVTATDTESYWSAIRWLSQIQAKIKYISFEPLLGRISFVAPYDLGGYDIGEDGIAWVIIGAQTKPDKQPKIEWVEEIVRACDKAGVPVFLKDNLKPLLEPLDITGTSFGRLTSLTVEAIKDTQGLPRQRGGYELRQEIRQETPK